MTENERDHIAGQARRSENFGHLARHCKIWPAGTRPLSSPTAASTTAGLSKNSMTSGRSTISRNMSAQCTSPSLSKPAIARNTTARLRATLIVKDIEDFLHERLLAAAIGFLDIDSHECDIIIHGRLLKATRDIGSAERSGKAENDRQQGIEQRFEGSALLDEQQDFHFERRERRVAADKTGENPGAQCRRHGQAFEGFNEHETHQETATDIDT
jgi:hypothetical protein